MHLMLPRLYIEINRTLSRGGADMFDATGNKARAGGTGGEETFGTDAGVRTSVCNAL